MQVLKPQALGLSTRPIEFRKRFGLSISACLHLPFAQGERGTLWAEQSMWSFLAKEMAQPLIDEGVAKLTPEFLVHGKAYAPADRPSACAVRARFGMLEKTLLVFGDRHWDGARPSAPAPFSEMPLDWSRAYGGRDHPPNMAGRGREKVDGVAWLPNTELPHDRLLRPEQAIAPAGFGALDLMHPQRAQYRGTYDADYLKQHAPGFAPDTDWRYFNLAPSDQWMGAPLAGDESFSFENMHPGKPLVEGRLPGMRARVFVGYRMEGAEPKIREVPLRLTTVWFFPHAERCIAIFQGLAEVGTDDGSDVVSLMGAVERIGEVRPDAHYLDAAAKRADPKMGPVYAIVDSDLLPEGVDTADPDVEAAKAPFAIEGLQAEAQYRRAEMDVEFARDKAIEMGQNPDALGIKMPPREKVPTGDALPAYLEKQMKVSEAQQWAAVEDAVTALEKALAMADYTNLDIAAVQHRGPPLYDPDKHVAEMKALAAGSANPPDLAPMYGKLCQIEDANRMGYLQSAHAQLPAFPMPAEAAAKLRSEMSRASAAGIKFFAGIDLTGADLSGLDLRDANFEGAWLESVDFRNSNLSGANFASAVLAHANLEGAIAIGAKFGKANLGKAILARGVFDDADFTETMFMHCAFAGTQMRRAGFMKANLLETTWGDADWSGAQLSGQTFYKLDLRGMRWPEADLSACNFIESDLSGVDMHAAQLASATFATCKLDGAKLMGAQCVGAVAVKDSSLVAADMSQANLRNFNFGASDMRGAKLVRAVLDGANLCEAQLQDADLRLASAKGALLRKAGCANALLSGVNFSDAILQSANLRGADLRRSNLFGADLSRVRLDGSTSFDGALLKRARTWPRLTPEQQASA
ncbi:uncharacterized protein YjbI with pentapeptide repeats [Variovorax sp. W1I1]|uniref:DUF2169 family type VI secretion system accessory protein n=1 Tax=Variovorax sp. W1I1 TaxID=3042309 RepID=UPI00277F2804|nr:DUF2169 domain-containing protein [Variovorax sp. W1I1]MDQ0612146.1 uncharacterized protein YjbI with pentapeptide repeats [Variovorax sp. W1I1]